MKILMSRPDHYDIDYAINPWMNTAVKVDRSVATEQWDAVRNAYETLGATTTLVDQVEGLPDMVFTANAGIVWKNRAVVSRFQHPERKGESVHWHAAFESLGLETFDLPEDVAFEGGGDAIFIGDTLFLGAGPRSDASTHREVARILDVEFVTLELADPRFYHLDTCFSPLGNNAALYFPGAFTDEGIAEITRRLARTLPVPEAVATGFGCNALIVGETIVATPAIREIASDLAAFGLSTRECDMSEYKKSGGAVRCCSLEVDLG